MRDDPCFLSTTIETKRYMKENIHPGPLYSILPTGQAVFALLRQGVDVESESLVGLFDRLKFVVRTLFEKCADAGQGFFRNARR